MYGQPFLKLTLMFVCRCVDIRYIWTYNNLEYALSWPDCCESYCMIYVFGLFTGPAEVNILPDLPK